jgi:hypothetical protein
MTLSPPPKMEDSAANVAMDTHASVQVRHPSDRPHVATIASYLIGDFDEWRTRHILRHSRTKEAKPRL